jgi:hypothetical protein
MSRKKSSASNDEYEASSRVQRSQMPYRLSPIQDHKRQGSGGLLSRLAVHAIRWNGEDHEAAQSSRTGR